MRAYKTVNDSYIEPISFTVPRRAETFQSDIYPPATGLKPAMSAKEWTSGKTALAPKIDLESIYDGNAPVEVAADYKPPASASAPAPTPAKPVPRKEPEPKPAPVVRSPPPSMGDQKQSISAMANRYQDDEDDDDDDAEAETSSFEEVSRPQPRASMPVRSEAKPPSPTKVTSPRPTQVVSPLKSPPTHSTSSFSRNTGGVGSPGSSSVEASLDQIKQLLEAQTKIISAQSEKINEQSEKIGDLAAEVDLLKKRVGSGSQDQSERIRQLELELEAARS